LRKAHGGYTHLPVAIDKFSKWVEVRPITNLREEQDVTFFTDIIYRFGVPNSIITDNGSQFTDRKLLTQNVHLAPNTQQAEQAGFTRAENHKTCQSIFPEN
jgi:hypothetical protein